MLLNRRHTLFLTTSWLAAGVPALAFETKAFKGGAGGAILRVTNLNAAGEGSLRAALETKGPRIVVFEVGGVIDLNKTSLKVTEPFLTIAGETAPDPGITLIKGGMQISAHDVIVRHIAIRPGTAGMAKKSGFEPDGLSTVASHNVLIDQCSFTWAVDEALSASGPRFQGATLEDWRRNTSHNITFSNNLIAESLRDASHAKGPHSMGSLIHDNVTGVVLTGNLYAHNNERHPLVKGGAEAVIVNNVFVNPGNTCVQYTLVEDQWKDRKLVEGMIILQGNVMRGGVDTRKNLPLLKFGGAGDLALWAVDNIATYAGGGDAPVVGFYQARSDGYEEEGTYQPKAKIPVIPHADIYLQGLTVHRAAKTEAAVYKNVGSRPWARDPIDARIIADAKAGRGKLIDSEAEVGDYPQRIATRRTFNIKTLIK